MHIHVVSPEGEAKFRLEPSVELAQNQGIPAREMTAVRGIVERRKDEIATAWRKRFS